MKNIFTKSIRRRRMWQWHLREGVGDDILRTWHNNFEDTSTSQACKDEEEFNVTTAWEGEIWTWEVQ